MNKITDNIDFEDIGYIEAREIELILEEIEFQQDMRESRFALESRAMKFKRLTNPYAESKEPEIKAKYGSQWINAQGYLETRFGRSHRLIYIEYWGSLDDDLIVHHIDGNKLNNHPSNLKAISNSEHIKLHNKLRNNIDCKWF